MVVAACRPHEACLLLGEEVCAVEVFQVLLRLCRLHRDKSLVLKASQSDEQRRREELVFFGLFRSDQFGRIFEQLTDAPLDFQNIFLDVLQSFDEGF